MIEITKTFLESIDMIANIYFHCWLIMHFGLMYKNDHRNLLFISNQYYKDTTNIIAYIALFIVLFLPKALYQ